MNNLIKFLRMSRPLYLLGAALVYALGAGIANYLGILIDWQAYLIGQVWVTMMQLSTYYLDAYFAPERVVSKSIINRQEEEDGVTIEVELPRNIPLIAALTTLTIAASMTVLMIRLPYFTPAVLLVMVFIFLGSFFYSTPPVRLTDNGYGDIVTAILIANLVPALAYLLQTGDLHRLLALTTFPLTFLLLALLLVFQLPTYGRDLKYERMTLMVRAGWEYGMRLHNISLLVAYVLMGLALAFNLPISIGLPAFLTFPLALFQIWYMNRIAGGIKPNWTLLMFVATAIFGLSAYLTTFALWTH
jgi:1,4-dihydroxy-2-naphthoate octaprenyltransferase